MYTAFGLPLDYSAAYLPTPTSLNHTKLADTDFHINMHVKKELGPGSSFTQDIKESGYSFISFSSTPCHLLVPDYPVNDTSQEELYCKKDNNRFEFPPG